MRKVITNRLLLEHMQGMKNDLQQQIGNLDEKITKLEENVNRGFEEARIHRQALQEDLDASITMLGKHDRKLARL